MQTATVEENKSRELVKLLMQNPMKTFIDNYIEGTTRFYEGPITRVYQHQTTLDHLRVRVRYVVPSQNRDKSFQRVTPNLTINTFPIDSRAPYFESLEYSGREGIELSGLEYLKSMWDDGHSIIMKGDGNVFALGAGSFLHFTVNPVDIYQKYAKFVAQVIETIQDKNRNEIIIE